MGPPVKIQISGFVRKEIIKNRDVLNPVFEVTRMKEFEIDGKKPVLYVSDPESRLKIEKTPQGAVATFTYPVDNDEDPGNGRCYVEDKWVYDPNTSTLQEVTRDVPEKTIIPSSFKPLCDRLKSLPRNLDKDDPLVQQFFKNVVLELPTPSDLTEEDLSSPGYTPALVLGSFKPISPPQSLEEAHLRRLVTILPTLGASYRRVPEANLMLQIGIGALQKGFIESNPAFEKLHQSSKNSVELKLLSQGLLEMSRGELNSARSLWTGLRSKNPAARALLGWLEDYSQAKKSLGTLKVIQTAIYEELTKDRKALGHEVQQHPEKVSQLISLLEKRIIQGKAHSIREAMRQLEATGSEEEKVLLARIQSPQFARGVVTDLARGSGLTGDLESQTMMAVAYEKLVPQQSLVSAAGVFRLMGEEGRSQPYAEAGKQGLLALSGQGNFAHELDFTVQRVTDQLTDPVIVASFIAGQSAYQWGQYYALSRWGGLGLRSTLIATGVGVSLEAPTFEFTQRALTQASGRDGAFRDFDKGIIKSWLTFGTFRGMGLGTRYGAEYLQKNQILPLGKWTIPVFTHASSFGALHGMGELERGLELKPREGSWPARFLLDGAFYLQATAVHPIGETLMGPNISSRIQGLERANSIISKFSSLPRSPKAKVEKTPEKGDKDTVTGEIKVPEPEEITRLGDQDLIEPRPVWVHMEAEKREDGSTVHPEEYFPLSIDKNTWWIGRDSKRSKGNLDIPLPGDTREVSRYHARISLDDKGNYILEPTPREESSYGPHSLFIYNQGWGPLQGPLNLQNGSKLRFEGTKIFKFSYPSSETDLKMLNRELAKYSVEIATVLDTMNPTDPVYFRLDPLPPKKGKPPVPAVEYGYGNWEAVTQPILLMKGAEVQIGDSRILHFDVPEPPAPVVRPKRASSPPPPPPSSPPPPPPQLGQKVTLKPTGEEGRSDFQADDPTLPDRKTPTILPPPPEGTGDPAASSPQGSEPILLKTGEWILGTTPNDLQQPRRANHHVKILNLGEAAAFTHVGIDKKHLNDANKFPYPINEDAYGMGLDFKGRPVFVVGDGMGYYGSGDHASARMVEMVLKTVAQGDFTLGEGLMNAHKAIQQDNATRLRSWKELQAESPMGGSPPEDAATVGAAIRVDPEGHVEVGLVGDIRLWLLKAQPDGNFDVIEPYFPDYVAGVLRERGTFRTTLQMLSADLNQNPVLSGLGHDEAKMQQTPLQIVAERKAGDVNQILNNVLTLPLTENNEARRALYKLQNGDHLLLMSDGVAGQFNRKQLGRTLQGKKGIQEMLKAISEETARRQEIYLKFSHPLLTSGGRAQIPDGRFIDRMGSVYATNDPADTEVVAHFSPDNVVALLVRYEPTSSADNTSKIPPISAANEPGSGPKRKRADTTQLNLSIEKASDIKSPVPAMPEPLPPPPFHMVKKSVALEPDKTGRLYKLFGLDESPPLLEGVRLHRGKEDAISQYRLLTSGGVRYTLLRQFGERAGLPQEIEGGNHFILGEIGEEVSLRVGDEAQTTYHIIIDDPEGNAAKLPQLKIFYEGREESHRFRSTDPKINFGRHYNPKLFIQEKNWISRQHFILTIGQMGPQRGYDLTVQCKYGLSIDGMYYPRGQMVFLQPGRHEIYSITNQTRDEAGQVHTTWDQSIILDLPPVEVTFPDWKLASVQPPPPPQPSPEHASTKPPPPPVSKPPVPGAQTTAPTEKPWWKFWKRRF